MQQINYFEIITDLSKSESISEIEFHCKQICKLLEVDNYSFVFCIPSSIVSPTIITLTNYPYSWKEHYFSEKLFSNDPVIQYSQQNITPIIWQDFSGYSEFNDKNKLLVMDKAKDYGLNTGFSIPIRSPLGEMSIFSGSCTAKIDQEAYYKILPIAQMLAPYLHEAVKKISILNKDQVGEINITNREKECLLWASEGKTAWEISQILAISERTVLFHLNNVSKKLGGTNRQHTVAKALLMGAIKFQI